MTVTKLGPKLGSNFSLTLLLCLLVQLIIQLPVQGVWAKPLESSNSTLRPTPRSTSGTSVVPEPTATPKPVKLYGEPLPSARTTTPETDARPVELENLPVTMPFGVGLTLGLGLPAPFKYGANINYRQTPKLTWELGYLAGSLNFGVQQINVGAFNEALYGLTTRYAPSMGSFNWIAGLAINSYDVHLGNAILSRLSGGAAQWDLLKVRTLALQLGVGNRWRFAENYFVGVDWIVITYPLKTLLSESPSAEAYQNESDRRQVQDTINFMQALPTANFLKTTLGYSF